MKEIYHMIPYACKLNYKTKKKNQKKDAIVKLILTFGKEKFWILVISKIFSIIETNNFLNFRTTFEQFSESALVSSFLFHNFGQK